jgi:hypothetical protein
MTTALGTWRDRAACRDADIGLFDTPVFRTDDALARLHTAIGICHACPVRDECESNKVRPAGMIWAGVPYNEYGRPLITCARCGEWVIARSSKSRYCSYECAQLGADR